MKRFLPFLILFWSCSTEPGLTKPGRSESTNDKKFRLDSLREVSLSQLNKGLLNYVEFYAKVLEIDSTLKSAKINHAYSIAHYNKNINGAVSELNAVLEKYPDDPEALFALGTILYTVDPDTAFYFCERSLQLDPGNFLNYYYLSTYYDEQKKYEKALETIEKAVLLRPRSIAAVFTRGTYKDRLGDHLGALDDMRRIPPMNKRDDAVYFNRACCFFALKLYANCIKDCDTALVYDPEYAYTYYLRGSARFQLKDLEGSFDDMKRSVELGNNDAVESYNNLKEYFQKHKRS